MQAVAKLKKIPMSARKVALLADLIRGKSIAASLVILQNKSSHAAERLRKLLLSVVANWENINTASFDQADVMIKKLTVDRAGMLKRIMPASKGMAHRIRRRFSHVTVVVDGVAFPQSADQAVAAGSKKRVLDKKKNGSKS